MTDRELLQQALDSLEWAERRYSHANLDLFNKPIEAIRTRLAQHEPEETVYGAVYTITGVTGGGGTSITNTIQNKDQTKTVKDLNEIIYHLRMEIKRLQEIITEAKH